MTKSVLASVATAATVATVATVATAALLAFGCRGESKTTAAADAGSDATASQLGPNEPANATPLPSASVRAMVNPKDFPVYAGPTASIEGTVTVTGDPPAVVPGLDFSRCPEGEKTYGKTFREGPARPDGSRPLADALVVVTGYAGYIVAERRPKKRITIERCAFSTRTIDLTFGQVLEVQNRDGTTMHAPELASHPMPALMVAPPAGDPVEVYPKTPGFTQLSDKMGSPWLVADVYTLLQPLHAVTDQDGHFRIDGIPTENADHTPIEGLEINMRLRAVNRDVTKPLPKLTANVVERVDIQVEHRPPPPPPDAGAPRIDAGRLAPIH